jgi:hypothetical protein
MKYFLDTEFIEDGLTINLISLGLVREDGLEFYAENSSADLSTAGDWVQANVLPSLWSRSAEWTLHGSAGGLMAHEKIGDAIRRFVPAGDKPEFWGYYSDYDWVAFCQLFGTMMDLPDGFPMYCRDIKQWCDQLGNPKLPEQGSAEHNALEDARWNMKAWEFLNAIDFKVSIAH